MTSRNSFAEEHRIFCINSCKYLTDWLLGHNQGALDPASGRLFLLVELTDSCAVLLTAVLTWLHVLGAVGWLGAVMFFGMVLGPLLGKLSPGTRSELVLKLFPKFSRYVGIFAVFTVIVGVTLALVMANGDLSIFAPTTAFGLYITTGATLALVTVIIAFALVIPSARKILKITQNLAQNPGPPPPELAKVSSRLRTTSLAGMILLLLVLVFMVAAVNA